MTTSEPDERIVVTCHSCGQTVFDSDRDGSVPPHHLMVAVSAHRIKNDRCVGGAFITRERRLPCPTPQG